jgi:DNA-binding response OmpR family regulator
MDVTGGARTRERVLVVEDNEQICSLIRIMLGRRGYEVIDVRDGQAAIANASDNIDVVLLDLGLPGMNGLEVCRRLRGEPETASLPVIMLTGRAHPEDVRDGLRAGASEFLVKPFQEAELLAAIQRVSRSRLP